jgi:hypothetical protein
MFEKLSFLRRRAEPHESLYPLQAAAPLEVDLQGITRGIDNVHVDVALSPAFLGSVRHVVTLIIDQQLGRATTAGRALGPTPRDWDDLRAAYGRMLEGALHRGKRVEEPRLARLAQLAAIQFVLGVVESEVERRRQDFKTALSTLGPTTPVSRAEIERRLARLARHRVMIGFEVARPVFERLLRVEGGALAETRQSLTGDRWSLPLEVFSNSLLLADSDDDDQVLMSQYVLLAAGADDPFGFNAVDQLVGRLFVHRPELASWTDSPANVDTLLNVDAFKQRLEKEIENKNAEETGRLMMQISLQKRLLGEVERRVRDAGLVQRIAAAYETATLHPEHAAVLDARQVHEILSRGPRAREITAQLREMPDGKGKALEAALGPAAARVARAAARPHDIVVRFLRDFVRYRRDRAVYLAVRQALETIAIQEDPRKTRLSRGNSTLHELVAPGEEAEETGNQGVASHTVLKADVRGSTRMVAELRKRLLNPASYFALKLFGPINALLEPFGASKTFIEGDAVILTIIEEEGAGAQRWGVARACGLARRLLGVVVAANAASRRDSLPELELGIGLAFSEDPPAFLYDGDSPIMISAAIARADRLSGCSWLLRGNRRNGSWTNVDVYEIPPGDPLRGEKGGSHLRYNVNGINLEPAAFAKLRSEIRLQEIEVQIPGDDRPTRFYSGSFPDLHGAAHTLLVREGRVRMLDLRDPQSGAPTEEVFYEVVTSEIAIAAVSDAAKLAGAR